MRSKVPKDVEKVMKPPIFEDGQINSTEKFQAHAGLRDRVSCSKLETFPRDLESYVKLSQQMQSPNRAKTSEKQILIPENRAPGATNHHYNEASLSDFLPMNLLRQNQYFGLAK